MAMSLCFLISTPAVHIYIYIYIDRYVCVCVFVCARAHAGVCKLK